MGPVFSCMLDILALVCSDGWDVCCLQVFQSIAKDVMLRLRDSQTDSPSAGPGGSGNVHLNSTTNSAKQSKGCC